MIIAFSIHRLILLRCLAMLTLIYLIFMDLQLYLYIQHLPINYQGR